MTLDALKKLLGSGRATFRTRRYLGSGHWTDESDCSDAVDQLIAEATRFEAFTREFAIQWIESECNYNNRVPSRDRLNALAREVLGAEAFEATKEAVRIRARADYAETSRRRGVPVADPNDSGDR